MTVEEMKPWQKGYRMAQLRPLAALWRASDQGYTLGAFTPVKENTIADWLSRSELFEAGGPQWPQAACRVQLLKARRAWRDFTGAPRVRLGPGDMLVSRVAYRDPDAAERLLTDVRGTLRSARLFVQVWQEKPADLALATRLGLVRLGTKIPASSELISLFGPEHAEEAPLPARDAATLERLDLVVPAPLLMAARRALAGLSFADHYSSYGKGKSWQALALRGYSDDPAFIAKPAEMSRKWKGDNAEALSWRLRDTRLRDDPAMAPIDRLCDLIPRPHHRVRLMRLAPGGGELARHADITDPDAGTAPGQLLRIHIPLVTNAAVRFEAWQADGKRLAAHMAAGEAWYLDTRKPHTARNGGETDRVHLVVDAEATPELLNMIVPAR